MKELRCLLNTRQINGKKIENPENFTKANRILTVVRSVTGTRQIGGMTEEANKIFRLIPPPPAVYMFDEQMIKLKQYCSRRLPLFVHISLYIAQLLFPWDINSTIKSEMGTSSMGQDVDVLTPAMFNAEEQP